MVTPVNRSLVSTPPVRSISMTVLPPSVTGAVMVSVPMEAPGASVPAEATVVAPPMVPLPPSVPTFTNTVVAPREPSTWSAPPST